MNYHLRQHQKMLRDVIDTDQMRRTLQVSMARTIGVQSAEMLRMSVYRSLAKFSEDLKTSGVVSESISRGLSGFNGNLARNVARMQSDVLRQTSTFAIRDLVRSVAQAFEAQGLASAYSDAWSLHRVPSFRTPTQNSVLKSTPTFGPIVVSPDDEAPPANYHPDLQGWLIPETATDSGGTIDVEELVAVVFAYALGIAQHHRTRVLVTVVGKHGGAFLIHVAETVVGGLILYWLLNR
jgi:hypothetical protein